MALRLLLFLLLLVGGLRAAWADAGEDTTKAPDEPVALRTFDEAALEELRATHDYDRDIRRLPTPWERFKAWLNEWLDRLLGTRVARSITDNLLLVIVFVTLVFALVMLSRGSLRRVFQGAPRSQGTVTMVDEDIREMDLAGLIREAEAAGDLRRAIRLHYLLVLRRLVDAGVLHWSPEHTDRDYLAQIKDRDLRGRFTRVVLVFQWVWYGHAEVDGQRYESLKAPFLRFEREMTA